MLRDVPSRPIQFLTWKNTSRPRIVAVHRLMQLRRNYKKSLSVSGRGWDVRLNLSRDVQLSIRICSSNAQDSSSSYDCHWRIHRRRPLCGPGRALSRGVSICNYIFFKAYVLLIPVTNYLKEPGALLVDFLII